MQGQTRLFTEGRVLSMESESCSAHITNREIASFVGVRNISSCGVFEHKKDVNIESLRYVLITQHLRSHHPNSSDARLASSTASQNFSNYVSRLCPKLCPRPTKRNQLSPILHPQGTQVLFIYQWFTNHIAGLKILGLATGLC